MDTTPNSETNAPPVKPATKPAVRTPRKRAARKTVQPAASTDGKLSAKAASSRSRQSAVAAAPKAAAASRRRKVAVSATEASVAAPNAAELTHMIATAAYFLAERRRFAPGYELEDWLAAESQILRSGDGSSART